MTIIYNNIPPVAGNPVDHVLTGCENQILFRADSWGVTQIEVSSFSASDPTRKKYVEFVAGNANQDWCIPCPSKGEVYQFSFISVDPTTTEVFVEILEQGCCCGTSQTTCFEIPVRLVPCE